MQCAAIGHYPIEHPFRAALLNSLVVRVKLPCYRSESVLLAAAIA